MTKRVAVVGAGVSGLCSVKSCLESGLDVVCFEQSDGIGGLWNYKPESTKLPGEGSVMKATSINTSKEVMAFSDFPPPSHFHNFMHHSQVLEYLTLYADNFELWPHIRLEMKVVLVKRCDDYAETGKWDVTFAPISDVKNQQLVTETFDGVMLCTGHHSYPYRPDIPGLPEFEGRVLHSHNYRTCAGFDNQTILVVGHGNSAGDIAAELGHRVAKQVFMSTRRPNWIFYRTLFYGIPYDILLLSRLGYWLLQHYPRVADYYTTTELNRRFSTRLFLRGPPKHSPFATHPFVNDDLPKAITSGAVTMVPDISTFTPTGVEFEDGTKVDEVDTVILCTGYTLAFPYLEPGVIDTTENNTKLYKQIYPTHLEHPGTLGVIGLIQPFGAIQAIAEMQSRFFVQTLIGNVKLPSTDEMNADVDSYQALMKGRYVASRRHTMQVDMVPYMDRLAGPMGCLPPGPSQLLFKGDFGLFTKLYLTGALPYQYRMRGPHAWPGAVKAIRRARMRMILPYAGPSGRIQKPSVFESTTVLLNEAVLRVETLCLIFVPFVLIVIIGWILTGLSRMF